MKTLKEIAKELNTPHKTVYTWIKKSGLTPIKEVKVGNITISLYDDKEIENAHLENFIKKEPILLRAKEINHLHPEIHTADIYNHATRGFIKVVKKSKKHYFFDVEEVVRYFGNYKIDRIHRTHRTLKNKLQEKSPIRVDVKLEEKEIIQDRLFDLPEPEIKDILLNIHKNTESNNKALWIIANSILKREKR